MELTIDTASPLASVALTRSGSLLAEATWAAGRGHAAELLPAIDRLLASSGQERTAIRVVFVDRGPGGYAGLRVGISTAMALAFALDADLLGFGRLEADAYPCLGLGWPVCAVHDAGRGEFAWAVYRGGKQEFEQVREPRIGSPEELVAALPGDAVVAGEVSARLRSFLPPDRPVVTGAAATRRAGTGAALAWSRYAAGTRDSHLALTPLYLREPNITAPKRVSDGPTPA